MSDGNGLYYMRARYYSPDLKRFVNRDVVVGRVDEGQSLNRFAFVSGNPINFLDPLGLAQVQVVTIGQTSIYYDTTALQLVNIINALPNSSIIYFRISGHGSEGLISLMRSDKGADYINGYAIIDGKHVPQILGYDSQGNAYIAGRLDELLKNKLHPLAKIEFAGCQTAKGTENLAKWLSLLLPEILVMGGATYQLGYAEGTPLIPFNGPSGMLGWKKTYITIMNKTHEWTSFSFFK